jgi:hypothetical protein
MFMIPFGGSNDPANLLGIQAWQVKAIADGSKATLAVESEMIKFTISASGDGDSQQDITMTVKLPVLIQNVDNFVEVGPDGKDCFRAHLGPTHTISCLRRVT